MILNGVKMTGTTVVDSAAASMAAGAVVGGAALAAGAFAVAAPAVAGVAIAAGALVVSARVFGYIRAAIFKSRVEDLEQHAKSLGLNPVNIVVKCRTNQEGDKFSQEHPRLLAHLMNDKELAQSSVENCGLSADYYRISREQVAEAKANMRAMSLNNRPAQIAQTFSGGSQVMADIAANKGSRAGYYSESRQQDIHQSADDVTPFRPRP